MVARKNKLFYRADHRATKCTSVEGQQRCKLEEPPDSEVNTNTMRSSSSTSAFLLFFPFLLVIKLAIIGWAKQQKPNEFFSPSLMGDAFLNEEGTTDTTPIKYLPINRVYSSTVPFNNPTGSKTSKTQKLLILKEELRPEDDPKPVIVYSRRRKKEAMAAEDGAPNERKKVMDEADAGFETYRTRLRTSCEPRKFWAGSSPDVGGSCRVRPPRDLSAFEKMKKLAKLDFQGADPNSFVGLEYKVFLPMDDEWYKVVVAGYSSATGQHHGTTVLLFQPVEDRGSGAKKMIEAGGCKGYSCYFWVSSC